MVLPFAYLFLRLARTRLAKLLLLALVVACMVGVVLSLSRGGILALALEGALILGLTTTGKRRVLAIVAVAMIGAVAINYQFSAREENQRGNYTAADAEIPAMSCGRRRATCSSPAQSSESAAGVSRSSPRTTARSVTTIAARWLTTPTWRWLPIPEFSDSGPSCSCCAEYSGRCVGAAWGRPG